MNVVVEKMMPCSECIFLHSYTMKGVVKTWCEHHITFHYQKNDMGELVKKLQRHYIIAPKVMTCNYWEPKETEGE